MTDIIQEIAIAMAKSEAKDLPDSTTALLWATRANRYLKLAEVAVLILGGYGLDKETLFTGKDCLPSAKDLLKL